MEFRTFNAEDEEIEIDPSPIESSERNGLMIEFMDNLKPNILKMNMKATALKPKVIIISILIKILI